MKLISVVLANDADAVIARQRARQVAEYAGFGRQDQVRIATAVSEIARNALQYAGGGRIDFSLSGDGAALEVLVSDRGPGIAQLSAVLDGAYRSATGLGVGLSGARRLMDGFAVDSGPGGTRIQMLKYLPAGPGARQPNAGDRIAKQLAASRPGGAYDEMRSWNQELVQALEELRQREGELRQLNQELEDTNRGVMALYAELDDKAASLRRADEIKSRFLSHMSHEFRTPLNSILALSRLLQSRVDGDLTPEQEKQIGYIRKAAEELADMVNDLLDLAKVEAGKTTIQTTEFTVANTFGALRGMLRPLQTSDAVNLVIEEPPLSLTLSTDEGKVSQILRNLISNALKFTDRGEVRVSVSYGREGVMFAVADTGIGIALSEQERIFQEFTQVDSPTQRRVRGTGLGLPLSRKLAELLGGTLTVQSEQGVGSTFVFQLPASTIVRPDVESIEKPELDGESETTILLVEDDEVARYLVVQAFKPTGAYIAEATNGIEGLEMARFERPNVIILDLNMPGANGFQVLEDLKADPETAHIPVVIYTSRSLTASERDRLERNAAAIVSKSGGGPALVQEVERLTGLHANR